MKSSKPRRWNDKVEYVVVERDGATGSEQLDGFHVTPTPTIDQILSRSYTKRQQPTSTDDGDDSDDDDDLGTTTTATPSFGTPPAVGLKDEDRYMHELTEAAVDHYDTVPNSGHCWGSGG